MSACRTVRWPRLDQLAAIKRIYRESFADEDRINFNLLVAGIVLGVLKLVTAGDPYPIGFALWARLPTPAEHTAFLAYLAVARGRRGQGAGSALLAEVTRRAAQDGQQALVWEVEVPGDSPQDPAVRRVAFYARQGGRVAESAGRYAEITTTGTTKPMCLMWRSLTADEQPESREAVVRWIRGIYRLAYAKHLTTTQVCARFMSPETPIEVYK